MSLLKDRLIDTLFASDLDGTLIPHHANHANASALDAFRAGMAARNGLSLAYVTGRSLPLTLKGCAEHNLPEPDWIVGDVGSSLHIHEGQTWQEHPDYRQFLEEQTRHHELRALHGWLTAQPGVREQPDECQSPFKHSFFVSPHLADGLLQTIHRQNKAGSEAVTIIYSVDGKTGDGLLDLLPAGVSKASAVAWLQRTLDLPPDKVVYAGDSGNDLEAFAGPWQSILVANTPEAVKQQARQKAQSDATVGELFCPNEPCLAGVMEGLAHFEVPGFS